jgi:hypothetical protein
MLVPWGKPSFTALLLLQQDRRCLSLGFVGVVESPDRVLRPADRLASFNVFRRAMQQERAQGGRCSFNDIHERSVRFHFLHELAPSAFFSILWRTLFDDTCLDRINIP